MPRFYFDVHDTGSSIDEDGLELDDRRSVRDHAITALPAIAADEIPRDGDRRHFVILVRDEVGQPIYSATLTYTGLWLDREAVADPQITNA